MPWLKLDDQIFLHPKIVAAGKDATLLHLSGLAYASSQLTDGFIPAAAVRVIAATVNVSAKGVARLVDAGLWEIVDGGYAIHDFLRYNPSKEETMAKRSDLSEKRAEAGRKGADKRWHGDGKPIAKTMANDRQTDDPHPHTPSPTPLNPEREKKGIPPTPSHGKAANAAVVPNAAYRLFARFCEETEVDESRVPVGEKSRQMGIAKAILTEHSEDEAMACTAFLRSQSWRTGLIDLGTVKSEIGRWKMSGSPPQERARAPTNGHRLEPLELTKLDETKRGMAAWNAKMDEEENGTAHLQPRNGADVNRLRPGADPAAHGHVLGSGEEPSRRPVQRGGRPAH